MTYALIEPCCGSAAFSMHMSGFKKPPTTTQGSKWRLRKKLEIIAHYLGFDGRPHSVYFYDVGPWKHSARAIFNDPGGVADELERLIAKRPMREVFDEVVATEFVDTDYRFVVAHLFLQRLAFSGKAVGFQDGRFITPGYNKTSAEGVEATDEFGEVKPQVPAMIRALRNATALDRPPARIMSRVNEDVRPTGRRLCLIDPPYRDSTKYPDGDLERLDVVRLAISHAALGAAVMVCEAEPVGELVELGWKSIRIDEKKDHEAPFRGKQAEYVTFAPEGYCSPSGRSSAGSASSSSGSNAQGSDRSSGSARSPRSVRKSSRSTGRASNGSEMSASSETLPESTSSAGVSLARTSLAPEQRASVTASTVTALDSGSSSPESLKRHGPEESSSRTSTDSLGGLWTRWPDGSPSSVTRWKPQDSEHQTLEPPTGESASSSSLWPTPTVKGNYNRKGASRKSGDSLATAVWATPTARDWKSGAHTLGPESSRPLSEQVWTFEKGPLNPEWVESMMGVPPGWTELDPEVLGPLAAERRKSRGKLRASAKASRRARTD